MLQGHVDAETALPTRGAFLSLLKDALLSSANNGEAAALLVLNVDHFEQVNHGLGHESGDQLLRLLALRLRGLVEQGDDLGYLGADEFAILLPCINEDRDVSGFCRMLSSSLDDPLSVSGHSLRVTVSIGIAMFPADGNDAGALFRHADMALRRAKQLGGRNWQFFSNEIRAETMERARLQADLPMAAHGQLRLFYQPLLDLGTGYISGLEAFVRWEHPEFGLLRPDRFLAIAEHTAVITEIGVWVMHRACQDLRHWIDQGEAGLHLAINVSPRQFRDPRLADHLCDALAASKLDASNMTLEITEKAIIEDPDASAMALTRLKHLGVQLVLDDFGTGPSSLNSLKRLPFHKVKIDRSFVQDVVSNSDDAAIAKAIISMAHNLSIKVIAEGVETEAQCDFLRRHSCDEIQGYLFSEALDVDGVTSLLRERRRLPDHLLRVHKPERTLLVVDDEPNIVSALRRLLRRDNYTILTAYSGKEGLEVLAQNEVDVIMSDQRMPGMTGVEFLRAAKDLYPDTIRIVLSGYTELQSVTDAVNEGAIYKFLTKPWDDTQLRAHVEEAFRRKEMADENRRLSHDLRNANLELSLANSRLEQMLSEQSQQLERGEISLAIVREALLNLPLAIIGLDDDHVVAYMNAAAEKLLPAGADLLGRDIASGFPSLKLQMNSDLESLPTSLNLQGAAFTLSVHRMGKGSESRGILLCFAPEAGKS